MPKRIKEDWKHFRDVVSGRTNRELKRRIRSGAIVRERPKGGKFTATIPGIEQPHFVHGDPREGLGRGPGKEGDVVGRDPQQGQGSSGAGNDPGDGIHIQVDLEYILKLMGEDLKLPEMKPKPAEVFDEVKIRYNDISKVGPESLRHTRRTMLEALKRLACQGDLDKPKLLPGCPTPLRLITPISSDKRYRQYNEIKIPSSNAVIFFARDCSGSMDDYRCDIVSDTCWWLDCWIRQFYKRTDRCYFVHDTRAMEVDEEQFYSYRYGGGTQCSSAFRAIADQLENRYPPNKFNIYIFYFSDGDNWGDDNSKMAQIIRDELGPNVANLIGITQVCPWNEDNSVKEYMDNAIRENKLGNSVVRTAGIGGSDDSDGDGGVGEAMTPEERDTQVIKAIRTLLTED